ncbi:MAG: ABC transporter permease, partial [Bacteroidales bacterium]
GEQELISGRIFIDSAIVERVRQKIPSARPLITYLANSVRLREKSAPYSFVAAIPPSDNHIRDNEIIINEWLAEDIGTGTGDTINLTWFDPGGGLLLKEKNRDFIVGAVINMNNELSDPSLMPDFPGISGSTTCSGWDAGVPILLDRIREKDEDYWNKFRGTPKAFISYNTGVRLWGNNFGPATAIRFPRSMSADQIEETLNGSIDPLAAGFSISDIRTESQTAAGSGVDFSTLFLSLGVFIILSCIILLSFAVSIFFDSRKQQIRTYHALGFKNLFIGKILFLETIIHTVTGAIPGVFTGYFINILIIHALNSVWSGAVQTNTLTAQFGVVPVISGFAVTFIISALLIIFKVRTFLKKLGSAGTGELHIRRVQRNFLFLILSFLIASVILILSFSFKYSSTTFSFISGSFFFLTFVLAIRQYYIGSSVTGSSKRLKNNFSRKYYSFYPSQAVTPVIFIAAGIFAVIITGANRQVVTEKMMVSSGGTGGFLLWMETAVPVTENLNLPEGRAEFGLDEPEIRELRFVQADKLNGDDASCLNLNHVTSPPLLGIDPGEFISRGSFSFASVSREAGDKNPWGLLNENPAKSKIYGIADQTVMQWGLKVKIGDTLKYRTENGQPLDIILCGGLKSSVFQGHLIISEDNLKKYFPSVAGSSVFLVDGKPELSDFYRDVLSERFSGYGPSVETTGEKLASFFEVTNTYLDVFTVLGAFGMVLGVAGMGFILIRNYSQRKREFAFMMATGYSIRKIRRLLLNDQFIILLWGILTGTVSGLVSTLPSLSGGSEFPLKIIILMVLSVTAVGLGALLISVRMISGKSLVVQLRKE